VAFTADGGLGVGGPSPRPIPAGAETRMSGGRSADVSVNGWKMTPSGRTIRHRRIAVRWVARGAGSVLLLVHVREGAYEASRLVMEKWVYGDRMFSIGFLAMLFGLLVGWLTDRGAAVLLVGGYVLAAGASLLGRTSRTMMGDDAAAVAIALLPFLVVGIAYAYAGRTMEPLA
jgi:hypothetical protein